MTIPKDLQERYDAAMSSFRGDTCGVIPLIERIGKDEAEVARLKGLLREYRGSREHAPCEPAGTLNGRAVYDTRCDLCRRTDAELGNQREKGENQNENC